VREFIAAVPAVLLLVTASCERAVPARVHVPADSAAGEVAFELAGPGGAALMLDVHINGTGPHRFVLDTGATLTCVHEALATELGLPEVRGVAGTGAGVAGQGALRLVTVDSLRMGGVVAEDLRACVLDLQHLAAVGLDVHGLIGLNVLRQFRVTIDFARNVVTFEPGS
jgi:predicted aspartyl protease